MKFASPGIDSIPSDVGVYHSGAGLHPATSIVRVAPFDWSSLNPDIDAHNTGNLIGNFPATKAPEINSIRIRRRGVSVWGGDFSPSGYGKDPTNRRSFQNPGGSSDHNAGASAMIAGGRGAASSFVRVNGPKKANEGQKLPVLPKQVVRGGTGVTPTGGAMLGTGAPAPISPKVYGFPAIIKVLANPAAAMTVKKG